jgi:hypothetical protein
MCGCGRSQAQKHTVFNEIDNYSRQQEERELPYKSSIYRLEQQLHETQEKIYRLEQQLHETQEKIHKAKQSEALLEFSSQAEYEEALQAQLQADSMRMDAHSAEAFEDILNDFEEFPSPLPFPPPRKNALTQALAEIALEQARPPPAASVALRDLASHSQNVHSAAVEGAANQSIAEILAIPLPPGTNVDNMVEFAKEAISRCPAGLNPATARAAIAELSNRAILEATYNRFVYKNVLAAVWSIICKHKDSQDIIRRLAEEVHEGVGMCNGGKIGRLVNSLRGFVNVGGQYAESGMGEAFQHAFTHRVVNNHSLTPQQRIEAAISVLDEFGIQGELRQNWLEHVDQI